MAANINLVTFNGKTVTPKTDGIIQDAAIGQCGIFDGCTVTANGNTINIQGGYGIIRGRFFELDDSSMTVTLPSASTLVGRLYLRLDLSNTSLPIQMLVSTATSRSGLPDLIQNDNANFENGIWDMELALFDVTTTAIDNLEETYDTITDNATLTSALQTNVTAMQTSLAIKTRTVSATTDQYGQVNVPSDIYNNYTLINAISNDYRYLAVVNSRSLIRILDSNGTHPLIKNKTLSLIYIYV